MSNNSTNVPFHGCETVEDERGSQLERIRVAGGWLYRAREWDADHCGAVIYSVALCFVPDPAGGT